MSGKSDLASATEARYRAAQAEVSTLKAREAAARQMVRDLDEMARSETLRAAVTPAMRAIGADLRWQGWTATRRASLQIQLAQILAAQGQAQRKMALAHAQKEAAGLLHAQERRDAAKTRARRTADEVLALMLIARSGAPQVRDAPP